VTCPGLLKIKIKNPNYMGERVMKREQSGSVLHTG
jgi:hypothetical protein